MSRTGEIKRQTLETNVNVWLDLDGQGNGEVETGIGFFDHMLKTFIHHSRIDAKIKAQGDLETGDHHTIEDIGICVGRAMKQALADKRRIQRYGWSFCPTDEALARAALDLSGRPIFVFQNDNCFDYLSDFAGDPIMEFFQAWSVECGAALHLDLLRGRNRHHAVESLFKAFAHAIRQAVEIDQYNDSVLSVKGML